jgi:hypothetical protein
MNAWIRIIRNILRESTCTINRYKNDLVRDTDNDDTNFSGFMIGTEKTNIFHFKSVIPKFKLVIPFPEW